MERIKLPGRTLGDFNPLRPGERQLLNACRDGAEATLGAVTPKSAEDAQAIRANFLRFLLLGGDEQAPVHERGVRLRGAFVEGRLDLVGCSIAVNVALKHCRFESQIHATDAHVNGLLTLEGSYLADGLAADRLTCSGGVYMRRGFKATGGVRLRGAQIGGNIDCIDGRFEVTQGDALSVDGASIKGDVFLSGRFEAAGEVKLLGAQIGGNLECDGGRFDATAGDVLSADSAYIKGNVFLRNGFKATGSVRLLGAQIGGGLECDGGLFEVTGGEALSADGAYVKGDVFLRNGFKATGEVNLLGAQIDGDLDCTDGHFEVKEGRGLSVDRAHIKGNVLLGRGFKSEGEVKLLGAQIGGDVDCTGGRFAARAGAALTLSKANVGGTWRLRKLLQAVRIDASHADVAVLEDELAAWAPGSVLDGLSYGALGGGAPTSGIDRLKWLATQRDDHFGKPGGGAAFRPQPWRHLQRTLRDMGHSEEAKQVGIAFEDRLREMGRIGNSPPGKHAQLALLKRAVAQGTHYAFGKLAGYGYRPVRLVAWMASVWLLCGVAYWWLALPPRSAMAPSDPLVFQNPSYAECQPDHPGRPGNWYLCGPLRGEYATFSPLAFSLDLMLPLVDLGQEKTWGTFVPSPKEDPLEELFGHVHWGHVARLLIWFETLFGWLSSLLLVAIVSGFSRRNDDG